MGNCAVKQSAVIMDDPEVDKYKKSKELDGELLHHSKQDEEKIKLLLLGAGESGKSTIFKQMKIIYGSRYTEVERRAHIPTIYSNIISGMKTLVDQAIMLNLADEVQAKEAFQLLREISDQDVVNNKVGDAIIALWADAAIQKVWDQRSQFQIIESVQYYFGRLDVIKMPDFVPEKEDIIYSRVRTTGIVTEKYSIEGSNFEMYDVGGQRNERRKWIHCFEGVTAVIFVAALSEYDQVMFEDPTKNRMEEALELFDSICNNVYFLESSMILFLNKKDIFTQKIKTKHIKNSAAFADYSGQEGDFDAGVQYFLDKFISKNKSNKHIYHHVTCATDTRNVQVVFGACKDIVLRQNIEAGSGPGGFSLE